MEAWEPKAGGRGVLSRERQRRANALEDERAESVTSIPNAGL